jgi:hypothetical protein
MRIGLGIGLDFTKKRGGGIPPSNAIAPVISGTAIVGQTLSSTTGTWLGTPPITYSYQWKRGVTNVGTNSSSYTLVAADAGQSITCEVTATNAFGFASATSNSILVLNTILDTYSNSAVAYSVRLLRGAYYGSPSIRVRRSSDNAEQNIGFTTSGNLDETALTTFVGANDAYVTTWYDQSGNGNNAIQTNATRQPPIVKAGVVEKVNGKVAADYNSAGFLFHTFTSNVIPATNMLLYYVSERTASGKVWTGFGGGNTLFGFFSNNALYFYGAEAWAGGTNAILGQTLLLGTANPTDYKVYQNNINRQIFLSVAPYSGSYDYINNYSFTGQSGKYQEGIIWNVNRTSDRTGITTNVNTYYGIF